MRIIVLFNLKPGVDRDDYERWARGTDIPGVRGLASVEDFQVYRTTGLFGTDAAPPYAYVETIDAPDPAAFGREVMTEAVQRFAAEFATYAEDPLFITTETL